MNAFPMVRSIHTQDVIANPPYNHLTTKGKIGTQSAMLAQRDLFTYAVSHRLHEMKHTAYFSARRPENQVYVDHMVKTHLNELIQSGTKHPRVTMEEHTNGKSTEMWKNALNYLFEDD